MVNTDDHTFQYTLNSLDRDLLEFSKSFKSFCQRHEVDTSILFSMEISLEELIVNSFSYGDKNGRVKVIAEIGEREMKITISDNAPPFNLLREAPDPPKGSLMERKAGGLGIHLVKNLNDRVEYLGSQHGNQVTLFKRLK